MFRVALFNNGKSEEWIQKQKKEIYDIYFDRDIAFYVVPATESTCGQRYNAVFFAADVYGTIRDEIILPSAALAPGDAWEIDDRFKNSVTKYSLKQGYRRDTTPPEDRVDAFLKEVEL